MPNDKQKQSFFSLALGLLLLMAPTPATTGPVSLHIYNKSVKTVSGEGTFQQAIENCHRWGEGWSLMAPRSVDEEKPVYNRMVTELTDSRLDSVWTTLRQNDLNGFRNFQGDGEIQLARKQGNICSLLKLRYEAVKAETCNSPGEGYICQITECTHCPYDISPRNCLKVNDKCFVFGCDVGGWYDARNTCSRQGFSIISMETKFQLQQIVTWLNKRQHNACTNFWVGLRKASWYYNDTKASLEASSTFWYNGEPKPERGCAVLQRFNEGFYWKSVSCDEKHSYICAQDVFQTPERTTGDSTSRFGKYGPTRTSVNKQQLSQFNRISAVSHPCERSNSLSVPMLSVLLINTALIIFLIVYVLTKLNKRKVKETKDSSTKDLLERRIQV